jgi:hypothetical protein
MLTYALGRPISRAIDREMIREIIGKLEADKASGAEKYRMQTLLQAIVASDAFRMK